MPIGQASKSALKFGMKRVGLLSLVLAFADAHPHAVRSEENCTCEAGARPFESYHIHVMFFWDEDVPPSDPVAGPNPRDSTHARALRKAFVEHFNITECEDGPTFDPSEKLCAFPVDAMGMGSGIDPRPFVTAEFAFYVPVDRYADAVPWMMANRGDLDVLVHPNTCGWKCSAQDHLLWSLWGGDKWKVRFQLPSKK